MCKEKYKIILDPNLFELEKTANKEMQYEHFVYLKNCVNFLADFCSVAIDCYSGAPYCQVFSPQYIRPPITKSHYLNTHYNEIRKNIQKLIKQSGVSDQNLDNAVPCDSITNMRFISESTCKGGFFKYLNTQINNLADCIIILGMNNTNDNVSFVDSNHVKREIVAIHQINVDCSNRVVNLLSASKDLKNPFPNINACLDLDYAFLNEKKGCESENISIMRKYGKEFASRNLYQKNNDLSKKNNNYLVYLHNNSEYAISIDQEHGGVELFLKLNKKKKFKKGKQSQYIHLGEYSFSGKKQKDAEPKTHILYS